MASCIGFDRVEHLVRVRARVGDSEHRFLIDTGIGLTVVSSRFAQRPDVVATGATFAARRMSGQVLSVPLVQVPETLLGEVTIPSHVAAVADLGADGPAGFDGLLGPGAFDGMVVTTDWDAMTLAFAPCAEFVADGVGVPLEVRREGPSIDPFVSLVLPSGRTVTVEVDTGSHDLILDTGLMADCDVTPDDPRVVTTTGTDETGFGWTRRLVTIDGSVHLAGAPATAQAQPRVQFQDIVHDGLVGTAYLERFRFSFDASGERMVLGPRRTSGG